MTAQTILPANSVVDTGFATNSCRFDGSSSYMHKDFATPTNAKKWTYSFWIKKSGVDGNQAVLGSGADGNNRGLIYLADNGKIVYYETASGTDTTEIVTNRLLRDPSAWYHIVVAVDTTQGTAANRVKIYVNGVQETSFGSATYPDEDATDKINSAIRHDISGRNHASTSDLYLNAYLAEVVFIDGSQYAPTSFGEFDSDSGIWVPIDVSGLTFGNNGFYLNFKDSANLGNDAKGGTDLTEVNLAATDQTTDTCTNNFATLNPLHFGTTIAATYSNLTEGNCLFTSTRDGSPYPYYFSTMAVSQGKWYAEFKRVTNTSMIGIATGVADSFLGNNAKDYAMYENGQTFTSGSGSGYGDALDNNDIIGVAMDLDNNKLYFSNQGVWQNSGDPESGATGTGALSITAPASNGTGVYHFAVGDSGGSSPVIQCNFGNPIVALSSGNADADDHGNFEYEVPSGYFALCSKNLAEYG